MKAGTVEDEKGGALTLDVEGDGGYSEEFGANEEWTEGDSPSKAKKSGRGATLGDDFMDYQWKKPSLEEAKKARVEGPNALWQGGQRSFMNTGVSFTQSLPIVS